MEAPRYHFCRGEALARDEQSIGYGPSRRPLSRLSLPASLLIHLVQSPSFCCRSVKHTRTRARTQRTHTHNRVRRQMQTHSHTNTTNRREQNCPVQVIASVSVIVLFLLLCSLLSCYSSLHFYAYYYTGHSKSCLTHIARRADFSSDVLDDATSSPDSHLVITFAVFF